MAISGFDNALTLQDRVRLYLEENMQDGRYVPLTTDQLAANIKSQPYPTYQALARLQQRREIEIEKDGKNIVGVKVNKLEPSGRTYKRAADRAKKTIKSATEGNYTERMVNLREYLNRKLAILKMREQAKEAGLPEDTIHFEENPYAEEGLILLNVISEYATKLSEKVAQIEQMEYDLEAARRDNNYLRDRQRGQLVGASG